MEHVSDPPYLLCIAKIQGFFFFFFNEVLIFGWIRQGYQKNYGLAIIPTLYFFHFSQVTTTHFEIEF